MDRSGFVGTCGTADLPPKLRVAIHVRLGDLRLNAQETRQAVETLSTALQLAADLQHRQPATKGKLHVLVVSDSSAAELATALAKHASKRKHPVRIDVQTERRWSDGVSHFDEATTSGLQPKDLNLTFIGVGNPLVALDCLASANVVISPCATSDPLFLHPPPHHTNGAKNFFEESDERCSNFVGMARLLSSGAFHGVPPWELKKNDVAKRSDALVAVLPKARDEREHGDSFVGPTVHSNNKSWTPEAVAAAYDAPSCRAAIDASWERFKWNATSEWQRQQGLVQTMSGQRSIWVRLQKAASRMLWNDIEVITSTETRMVELPFDEDRFGPLHSNHTLVPPFTNKDYVWTTARDPATRALSGYAEVAKRLQHRSGKLPWNADGAPTANYASFLEKLRKMTYLHREAFHAWPAAILIDVVPLRNRSRFDAMARVEQLEEDLRHVLTRAGAKQFDREYLDEKHHSHAEDERLAEMTRIETADPRVMRAFCELYEVDYACFPAYAPPKACFDLDPEYLSSHS